MLSINLNEAQVDAPVSQHAACVDVHGTPPPLPKRAHLDAGVPFALRAQSSTNILQGAFISFRIKKEKVCVCPPCSERTWMLLPSEGLQGWK